MAAFRDVLGSLPIVVLVTLLDRCPARAHPGSLCFAAAAPAGSSDRGPPDRCAFTPLPLDGPTEVRELTDRFNAMSAELEATRKGETELLANLRHDLRTPLTVISGFATP